MQTRRDFLRSAAALSGTSFVWGSVPEAIARAAAIDPDKGTTFLDAEHVVVLMQENRSFDHCYGALRGVRGFRDPRAHVQPDGNEVWFQTDAGGKTYAPFHLDIKGTRATWIGSLPHSWTDQVDARNGGHYDKWLIAKGRKELPFTLGFYDRRDIPFYYALADAFTVCDQAFCSSLTGTTPNRLFLWTGTIRKDATDPARTQNGDTDYDVEAAWTTFPERLEDAGVSWRIYQNEISLDSGFKGEEDDWLGNFTDNPIEWFTQYNVRFAKGHRDHLDRQSKEFTEEIARLERLVATRNTPFQADEDTPKRIADLKKRLGTVEAERAIWNDERWNSLTPRAKALHEKAFCTNVGDPHYRELTTLEYDDNGTKREVQVPKGDTLHQFRADVRDGKLPAVSWIVAPCNFSDHPGAAWYGAWYLSECLNILTGNPEVWKKTIFVLCYDENDGYFDHVPPFVAPHPGRPETGKVSEGIDTAADVANVHGRDHSIGLGFRCPLVVASPWSRGGCVNSQVFDHTSVLQLMETWLEAKGKNVKETNISDWRRTVCGDMSSIFRPYNGEKMDLPEYLDRDKTVEGIHQAKFKKAPVGGKALSKAEIAASDVGAAQEAGTRPSCPLPYQLAVNGARTGDKLHLVLGVRRDAFGEKSQGSPFNAYSYDAEMICRTYAVRPGDEVRDEFSFAGAYHVRVDGPNGFMREFKGRADDPGVGIMVAEAGGKRPNGKIEVRLSNESPEDLLFELRDESYGGALPSKRLRSSTKATVTVDTAKSHGWYDFTVHAGNLAYRYAGRVETGKWTITDPAMGGGARGV